VAALFAALYRMVPEVELEWKDVALGALITSLLFMAGKEFMGLYFAHARLRAGLQRRRRADGCVALGLLFGAAILLGRGVHQSVRENGGV
jgi:hypothetical protein